MRFAIQKWDTIRGRLEIVAAGVGQTALAPTVAIQRVSDGLYLAAGGGAWAAPFATNPMVELSAANLPGLYEYAIPVPQLDLVAGRSGYRVKYAEGTTPILEYEFISPEESAWDELRINHVTPGSFGEGVKVSNVNPAAIVASSFGAGAIDASAIATDAIDADAIATDAFGALELAAGAADEIAAAVWDEAAASHVSDSTFGGAVYNLSKALLNDEGSSARHVSGFVDALGQKFHAGATQPVLARSASFAGRLAVFRDTVSAVTELVRIVQIANDVDGDYFEIAMVNGGGGVPGGISGGHELYVLNANDFSADEVWDEPMAAHNTDGTSGDHLRRMLSLRQHNLRVVYDAWNANGVPSSGLVLIYDSAADLNADADPWPLATGQYTISASFDGSLRIVEYKSVKDS